MGTAFITRSFGNSVSPYIFFVCSNCQNIKRPSHYHYPCFYLRTGEFYGPKKNIPIDRLEFIICEFCSQELLNKKDIEMYKIIFRLIPKEEHMTRETLWLIINTLKDYFISQGYYYHEHVE